MNQLHIRSRYYVMNVLCTCQTAKDWRFLCVGPTYCSYGKQRSILRHRQHCSPKIISCNNTVCVLSTIRVTHQATKTSASFHLTAFVLIWQRPQRQMKVQGRGGGCWQVRKEKQTPTSPAATSSFTSFTFMPSGPLSLIASSWQLNVFPLWGQVYLTKITSRSRR